MKDNYRKKVLISAYSCQPGRGSEPGIGWNWAKQAARFNGVWVLTRADNKAVIEKELQCHPDKALNFVYVDLPRWISALRRGEKGTHLHYYCWQIAAYRCARELHKKIGFDLTHHLTFGNVWLPTFLWKVPIPFIWGPLGGYETIPLPFWKLFTFRWKIFEILRGIIQFWSRNLDPLTRLASMKASFIIARTKATAVNLSRNYPEKIRNCEEFGVDAPKPDKTMSLKKFSVKTSNLNILMVGRLIHWKGFSMGIEAFKKLSTLNQGAKLHIVGSGPEEKNLESLVCNLGIIDKVIFYGQLPRQEVLKYYKKANIFFHPSLKDGGATVIFEALEACLPIVCFDIAGPGEIVTESCGIKVSAKNPQQAIEDFTLSLIRLANDRLLRQSLSQGAKARLEDLLWDKKGVFINDLYTKAIN